MAGMLWCEQRWTLLPELTDSWCMSASKGDKVASVCHMVAMLYAFTSPDYSLLLEAFPNMKCGRHNYSVECCCSFTCYSCQTIGSLYQECHTSKLPYQCHSTWSGWRWKVWKKVLSGRTPCQSCQRNNCFELLSTNAVVFFTQHLLIIFFWICKSHFLNAWVTPIINPSDVIGNPVVQSANLHSTMQQD